MMPFGKGGKEDVDPAVPVLEVVVIWVS